MLQEQPIDTVYLHDVAIPSCEAGSRTEFVAAVAKLESSLEDFRTIMHDVGLGKVAVWKRLDTGRWNSTVERQDSWTSVAYTDRLGPVRDVQRHGNNSDTKNYSFQLDVAGFVTRADLPLDAFSFDEKGRLTHWHGAKADYWGSGSSQK